MREIEHEFRRLTLKYELRMTRLQKTELKIIVLQKLIGYYQVMMSVFPENAGVYKETIDRYNQMLDKKSDDETAGLPDQILVPLDELKNANAGENHQQFYYEEYHH